MSILSILLVILILLVWLVLNATFQHHCLDEYGQDRYLKIWSINSKYRKKAFYILVELVNFDAGNVGWKVHEANSISSLSLLNSS